MSIPSKIFKTNSLANIELLHLEGEFCFQLLCGRRKEFFSTSGKRRGEVPILATSWHEHGFYVEIRLSYLIVSRIAPSALEIL